MDNWEKKFDKKFYVVGAGTAAEHFGWWESVATPKNIKLFIHTLLKEHQPTVKTYRGKVSK